MMKLHALSFRARSLALNCALFVELLRFARRRRASRPRLRHARSRFALSGFHRFACLLMVAVMFFQFALFPPEVSQAAVKAVSAKAADYGQNTHFWWHSSGWAAWSERLMRENFPNFGAAVQQRGAPRRAMPKPAPQETQEERNGRVARLEISPREATIAAGEEVFFIAVAYDANNSQVGGVSFDWDKVDEDTGERAIVEEKGRFSSAGGRFSSAKEGNYRVKVKFGGLEASARVKVKGVKHPSGQRPIGTRTVSSSDLPQPSRSSLSLPATKDRIAKNAPGRFMTKYSSAGTKAMPRLLPAGDDPYRWNSDNFRTINAPGKTRGNPIGNKPDGGAGSGNFQFAAPVLSLEGRGLDLNLSLTYNSRVWHKANSEITFDIDSDWPAAGWSVGYGKIVGMGGQNGYMLVEPDGTRHPYRCTITTLPVNQEADCKTTDGSFIDYHVLGDSADLGGAPLTSFVFYPDGTEAVYVSATSSFNSNYPSQIIDANGNRMLISYRNNKGPEIDKIADTMGRVVQFYYDSNNLPVAITAPGYNGTTRTLVRITYDSIDLRDLGGTYGFSGLTPKVRNYSIPVIKAIYYPANKTGYWFGDLDSYSDYGMLAKVIEQRGMDFSAAPLPDPNQAADPGTITQGLMTRQMVYDYQMAASGLTQEPSYLKMTESWAFMDVEAPETHYFVDENASPRRVEITRPDGVKTVMLSHNAPGQSIDGKIFQDETYTQEVLIGKSFVQWEEGECPPPGQAPGPYQYCSARPSRVEITDERGQRIGKEFSYGPRYNQVTEIREYGYGYVSGGANTLLRKTVNQYLNDPNYNDPQPLNDLVWHHLFNLVTRIDIEDGNGVRLSRTEYSYDEFHGVDGLMDTPGVDYGGYESSMSPYQNQPNYTLYHLDSRGNVTTIKRYADAETLDEDTTDIEIRHYDITGNVRKMETDCCTQTTINYTLSTQYALPESQTSGSPTESEINKRNTTKAVYDFNTGLVNNSRDANDRPSQFTYYTDSLRPEMQITPTLSFNYYVYDDAALKITHFVHEAGAPAGGSNYAAKSIKSLDGHGSVISEITFGKDGAQDIVDIKYDQLGRVSQRSMPYRAGATPQWNRVTYDSLDRPKESIAPDLISIVTRTYNQADPPDSADQPGQTILVSDQWGRERWARYDALGHLVEVAEPDPDGNGTLSSGAMFTTYAYDALGRLTQVNQGAQTRSFRHDSLGRLTHQKLAERDATLNDGGDWVGTGQWSDVFSYDRRSNLTQSIDARGVKTLYLYNDDPLDRLQEVQYDKSGSPPHLSVNIPVAPNVSYTYMADGDKGRVQNVTVDQQNVTVDHGMGNETMSYDSEGRLSRVTQTFTGRESYPIVTDYIWDSLDRLKESDYPKPYGAGEIRKKVEPAYDAASRIESLKYDGATYASEPVYNAGSQMTSLKVGGHMKETSDYDPKTGLLTNQKVIRDATDTLVDLKYNYTLNNDQNNNGVKTGQLTGITDLKNQARNRAYEYDRLGRLSKVKGGDNAFTNPTWNQIYSYDRYGNRSMIQHTELAMGPVNPGSKSRSDLIGKVGQGTGGAANRIFSAGEPFAALGINKGYGSITADSSGNDNDGTPMRGGPRVYAEEHSNAPSANVVGRESLAKPPAGAAPSAPRKEYGYRNKGYGSIAANSSDSINTRTPVRGGARAPAEEYSNAPSANVVGRELLAKHPAGAAPSAPRKEYGYRGGRSPAATQSGIVTVYPGAYQTPDATYYIGSLAVNSPSNAGHGSTTAYSYQGYPAIYDTPKTCRWTNFQSVSGQITGITLKFDWTENNVLNGYYASYLFGVQYSIDGGSSWTTIIEHSCYAPYGCVTYPNFGSTQITLPAIQDISQVQVRDVLAAEGGDYGGASSLTSSISNIRLEVAAMDITPPVISNVAAGGITSSRATITWNTNENSDSQVDYGTTANYGQSTTFNSEFGTTHSKVLTGLTAGTQYHYRVKSRDASGNLAVSTTDYTFTTDPLVISSVAVGDIAASCLIITWATNYNSDSQVEYGPTTDYGQSTTLDPTRVTAHSQLLNGLTAGTLYHYRVRSRDEAGNLTVSGDFTHTTGSLVVTNVAARNITTTSATISWTTNEPTNSLVEYGLTTAYGQETTLDPTPVTEHSQVLTGLSPGTLYHYRVESGDAAGNHGYCSDFTFTTAQTVPTDGLANLSYDDANNRINTAGFEYDPAGNQTRAVINASGAQQQYRYDCAGRLAQALDGAGNELARYSYGAGNQRLKSVEGGVTKYFAWDGSRTIAEYEASGANALVWKTSYIYLGGRLLATTSGAGGTETRFHHQDRLGTRLVTSVDGTVVTEQFTLPFGNMQPFTPVYGAEKPYQNPTLINPSKKRFTSYDRSDVAALDYAVNRFYSPQQGRFTQVDPIGMDAASLSEPQTLNLYSYCGNDPINHFDPDGLFWKFLGKLFKWVVAALAVAVAVVTIIYAPMIFASTLTKVFGIISALANAGSALMSAIGTKGAAIAGKVFGIIGAAADFVTSIIEVVGAWAKKGLKLARALLKAGQRGASLASKSLDAAGEKRESLAVGLAADIAGFIGNGVIQDVIDPGTKEPTGDLKVGFPKFWATVKFSRQAAEKSASLKGADKLAAYLNLAGIVDDVYDYTVGLKDFNKALSKAPKGKKPWDLGSWKLYNTLKTYEARAKNLNSIVGRVNSCLDSCNCLKECKGAQ